MELCIFVFGFVLIVGIFVGMIVGIMCYKWQDNLINVIVLLGFLILVFWLVFLLMLFCLFMLGWLFVLGCFDLFYEVKLIIGFVLIDVWFLDLLWWDEMIMSVICYMILFVIILLVVLIIEVICLMCISIIEVYDQNYVKVVVICGLLCFIILCCYVLYNVLLLVIFCLGLQFFIMLMLVMIIEMVFSWLGLGCWLINVICQQDYAVIFVGVMVCGLLVIIVNVIFDILGVMVNFLKYKEWYVL